MDNQTFGAWKELINKEQQVSRQWKQKYARATLEEETNMLLESFKQERQRKAAQAPEKRDATRKLLYEGVTRENTKAYLKERRKLDPRLRLGGTQLTSSSEIGWRAGGIGHPLEGGPKNLFEQLECGHKPVIESTFYRKSGVFTKLDHLKG
eukprot:RCo011919